MLYTGKSGEDVTQFLWNKYVYAPQHSTEDKSADVFDVGDIEQASASDIAHIQRCQSAGRLSLK